MNNEYERPSEGLSKPALVLRFPGETGNVSLLKSEQSNDRIVARCIPEQLRNFAQLFLTTARCSPEQTSFFGQLFLTAKVGREVPA